VYFFGGLEKTRSHNQANLRIWSKIRVFLGLVKFVSACVERDKKKFEKMDFCW